MNIMDLQYFERSKEWICARKYAQFFLRQKTGDKRASRNQFTVLYVKIHKCIVYLDHSTNVINLELKFDKAFIFKSAL